MSESREAWKARLGIGQPSRAFRLRGGPGTTKSTPVLNDDGPGVSGERVEHWSGRVDGRVTNPTVTVNPNLKGRTNG